MIKQLRIALVGIGGYGTFYVDALLRDAHLHGARFVAGIDPAPARSSRLERLQQAGVQVYPSLDEFARHDAADLVVLAAPIHLHAPLTIQALAYGANVLCEKPLCAQLAEADAMAQAEHDSGKFVAIGYQWSFSDPVQALKRDVLAGNLGRPQQLKTLVLWPRPRAYYARNRWAGRIRADDGAWVFDSPVNNATAHYLHNMLYLLGGTRETSAPVDRLEAQLWRANAIENYDAAALRAVTADGVEILMMTAHPVPRDIGPLAQYTFEQAVVEVGADRHFRARWRNGRTVDYGNPEDTETNKLWQCVAAVRGGGPVACGIAAARPHAEIVNRLQALPVASIPAARIAVETRGEDSLVWVRGLEDAFQAAYDQGQLASLA